ncbi:GNAT family N-acetyltransferase [Arthrobacter castelli]|uniref:GNAT family N-acetyltransferase n=1 Tax=Arthrobacter castelli TaxID=271431 RepID=UPI00068786F7|nr:GNAT family N-acetyltransferase [Arthrobacter castelli]
MTILTELDLRSGARIILRRAETGDVPAIVHLLADDELGAGRDGINDDDDLTPYLSAFSAIDSDPAHLLVAADDGARLAGTMQLSFLPGLSRRGAMRTQVEAVRVASAYRGTGLGTAMMTWAIAEARRRHCSFVQLTSDKSRTDAHRFYARLGFVASHEGMKLAL